MNVPWMGRYGGKVFDQGYRIVPIQPRAKYPIDKDWEINARQQSEDDVEKLAKERPYCGIGILTACNPAVDIDVRHAEFALRLERLAHEMIGPAPVRIGAPPKRLLVYRTDVPFQKMRSRGFTLPGDKLGDKAHQIEILGDGQQFVAYGIHPGTGRRYDWPEDSPLDIAADDLTPITAEQARAFIEAAESLLITAGGKPMARMAGDTGPQKTNTKLTAAYALIADAITAVPNGDAHYDEWIVVGMALKAAVGESGKDLFHAYSQKSSKYDAEFTDGTWSSLKPDRIGAGSIFHWAKKFGGWTRPASAASRDEAGADPPYWSRPTLDATRGGRQLDRIITAFFNEVERRSRCRERVEQLTAEWSGSIPDGLPDDTRSEVERRTKSRATRQAMREFKLRFWRNPRIQIKAPAGLGKSTAIRTEYLGRRDLWRCHIHIYVPDLRLAEAFKKAVDEQIAPGTTHKGHQPRAVVMYGRTRGMETGTARCLRPELAAAVEGRVGSTYQAICSNDTAECPLITRCRSAGYLAQYEDQAPALRIFPHAHLGIEQPEDLRLPKPDLVIIDEGCIDALREQLEVPLDWLADPRVYGRPETLTARGHAFLGSRVAEAIREHGPMLAGLREAGVTADRLREAAAGAKQAPKSPDVRPDTPPDTARLILAQAGPLRGPPVAAALEQLAADLEKQRARSIGVEYVPQHSGTLDGQPATFPALLVHQLRDLSVHPKAALCLIDADADAEINQTIFGPLRCFELAVRRRGHVIQCDSTILAKNYLLETNRELDKISRLASRKVSEQVFDRDLGAFRLKRVLVVTNKPVRVKVTGETADRLDLAGGWHGAEVTHFGAFLGQNRWEKFDVVIVVGREQIPPLAAERMARAVYANADVDLTVTGEYVIERRGYDLRDDRSAWADVWRHPDDLVQTFVELKRERSMAQAVDRLRLLHPDGRSPEVIILCNIPLPGVAVDCLMSLDDICDGGTPVARAFAETAGAMPLVPATLARRHPHLFTSPTAAESALRRDDLGTVKKQIEPICDLTVSSFREKPTGGHGGARRWSKALLAADTFMHRGIISLAVGRPLIWEHPPAGVGIDAPMILQALGACQPGDRLMHDGCEIGRIGKAGIPLPTFHYHLDDECYPVRLGDRGDVFQVWFTWLGIAHWLPRMRLMPPSTSPQAADNPNNVAPIPARGRPAELHEHPAGSTVQ